MSAPRDSIAILLASSTLVLTACGVLPYGLQSPAPVTSRVPGGVPGADGNAAAATDGKASSHEKASEVVLFALGLIETDYRFGGKNPEAGLDCSGMVSYVFEKSVDLRLAGSAADLARKGKPVPVAQLRPGDLVFFNTRNRPHSHVGIYIGDDRFVHAPSSRGKVRTESLKQGWFAARFEEGRSYFE
jgi:cell wall-associated NlpC family hydrolase